MGRVYLYLGGIMGLADDLDNPANFAEPVRTSCKICDLLTELPKNEVIALNNRLEDKRAGHTAIADVLMKNGYNISRSSVSRHRKGNHVIK